MSGRRYRASARPRRPASGALRAPVPIGGRLATATKAREAPGPASRSATTPRTSRFWKASSTFVCAPGMYIGTTARRGLHHLVYEVVDNAIDEAMAGRCDRIVVTLHADGSAQRRRTTARGIPVKPIPRAKDRRPAVEVVLTTLNAGGKFGGGGYRISGGPARRRRLGGQRAFRRSSIVEVKRDGVTWHQAFARGKAHARSSRRARPAPRPAPRSASGPTPRSSTRRSSSTGRSSPSACRSWRSSTRASRSS